MSNDSPYKLSQGYEVLPPKSGKAYPILCDEWDFLKTKINSISYKLNIYLELGFLFVGISFSTFVAIITGAISSENPTQSKSLFVIIAWAIVVTTIIIGLIFLFFAYEIEKIKKQRASEIVSQMEIIEKRYVPNQ